MDALLYIDITPLVGFGPASEAYLGLYAFYTHSELPGGDPPGHADIYANLGSWDVNTVTWNTAPATGSLISSNYCDQIKNTNR